MNLRYVTLLILASCALSLPSPARCQSTTGPKYVWNVYSTSNGAGVIVKVPRQDSDPQNAPEYFLVFAYHLVRPPTTPVPATKVLGTYISRKTAATRAASFSLANNLPSTKNCFVYDQWSDLAIATLRDAPRAGPDAPPAGDPELTAWDYISLAPDTLRSVTAIVYGSPKTLFSAAEALAFSAPFEVSTAVVNHIERQRFPRLFRVAGQPVGSVLQLSLTDARQGYSGGPVVITDPSKPEASKTDLLAGIIFAADADRLAALGTTSSDILQGIGILKSQKLPSDRSGWKLVPDVAQASTALEQDNLSQPLPAGKRAGRTLIGPSPGYDYLVLSTEDVAPSVDAEGRLNLDTTPQIKFDDPAKPKIEFRPLKDFLLTKESFLDANFEKTIFYKVHLNKDNVSSLKGTAFQQCYLHGLEITGVEASLVTFDHCKMGADCLLHRFRPSSAYGVQLLVDPGDANEVEIMKCVEREWRQGAFSQYYEVTVEETEPKERKSVLCVLSFK